MQLPSEETSLIVARKVASQILKSMIIPAVENNNKCATGSRIR
jgi:hypothetical protein